MEDAITPAGTLLAAIYVPAEKVFSWVPTGPLAQMWTSAWCREGAIRYVRIFREVTAACVIQDTPSIPLTEDLVQVNR